MDPERIHRPQEGQHEKQEEDIWTSAFDSQNGESAEPPPFELKASSHNPDEGGPELSFSKMPPTDRYPSLSQQRSVTIAVPAESTQEEVLVGAVCALAGLSAQEARTLIDTEGLRINPWNPEGIGRDEQGRILHRIRLSPTWAERTKGESLAPDQMEDPDAEALYQAFSRHLASMDNGGIGDLGVLFDEWASACGLAVGDPAEAHHHEGFSSSQPSEEERSQYHHYLVSRTQALRRVELDRARLKRAELSAGIPHQETRLAPLIQAMSDNLAAAALQVDPEALSSEMTAAGNLWNHWTRIKLQMMLVEDDLLRATPGNPYSPQLSTGLYQFAYFFADHAASTMGRALQDGSEGPAAFDKKFYGQFHRGDLERIKSLLDKGDGRSLQEHQQLALEFYKASFAFIAYLGALQAHRQGPDMWGRGGDAEAAAAGREVERAGRKGGQALDLMREHPGAQRVHATFMPREELGRVNMNDPACDHSKGIELELYLWYDTEAGEWVLEDLADPDHNQRNSYPGKPDGPVPHHLFAQLDSKYRLPAGALMYRLPQEGGYRILQLEGKASPQDQMRWLGMAAVGVGMTLALQGGGVAASMVLLPASMVMAGAELGELMEMRKQNELETERVVLQTALVASCLLGGAGGFLAETGAGLTQGGRLVARVIAGAQVGTDTLLLGLFSKETYASLTEAAKDPDGMTFQRMLSFALQMGMNGMMLLGIRGSAREAAGMTKPPTPEVRGAEEAASSSPGPKRRYKPKLDSKRRTAGPKVSVESGLPANVASHPAYRRLSKTQRLALEDTMGKDSAFASGIAAEPELIDAWAAIAHLHESRNSIDYLKALRTVMADSHLQQHIFEGHYYVPTTGHSAGTIKATGMHSEIGMRAGKVRQKPGTGRRLSSSNPEVYEAHVQHRNEHTGGWVDKSNNGGKSTIFPPSWSKQRTLEEVAYAYDMILKEKSSRHIGGNEYWAKSSDNTVEIHVYLGTSDELKSAFPVLD